MRECYHKPCDNFNSQNVTDKSIDVLHKITQAMILAVVKLTQAQTEGCDFNIQLKDPVKSGEEIHNAIMDKMNNLPLEVAG